jgi:hypothetical protein
MRVIKPPEFGDEFFQLLPISGGSRDKCRAAHKI